MQYYFAVLLAYIPPYDGKHGDILYRKDDLHPLHDAVQVTLKQSGFLVSSPVGKVFGCSAEKLCDITWKVDLENTTCPCAFNHSCCRDGVTLSFWWSWSYTVVPYYRFFLDLGGIYIFYNVKHGDRLMSVRMFGSENEKWYLKIWLPHDTWSHLAFTMQSQQLTVYMNGRYVRRVGPRPLSSGWYPGASALTPHFWLRRTAGNYSFGNLQLWGGVKSAAFLWRQHYEQILFAGRP